MVSVLNAPSMNIPRLSSCLSVIQFTRRRQETLLTLTHYCLLSSITVFNAQGPGCLIGNCSWNPSCYPRSINLILHSPHSMIPVLQTIITVWNSPGTVKNTITSVGTHQPPLLMSCYTTIQPLFCTTGTHLSSKSIQLDSVRLSWKTLYDQLITVSRSPLWQEPAMLANCQHTVLSNRSLEERD